MLGHIGRAAYGLYAIAAFVVVVLLLFCPLLIAAPFLPLRRQIGRLTVRAWLMSVGVRLKVSGLAHLPEGPCIVVCNHASYVDGIVLTAALPVRVTFLVQHGAANWPYVGLVIRRMGVRFVNRELPRPAARAMLGLIHHVRAGGSVAIFPEGAFRADPGLQPFHAGAFLIAAKTGAPVVPAVMRGTRRFFHDGARWPRRSNFDIELFAPRNAHGPDRADAEDLANGVFEQMRRHCGEALSVPVEAESSLRRSIRRKAKDVRTNQRDSETDQLGGIAAHQGLISGGQDCVHAACSFLRSGPVG